MAEQATDTKAIEPAKEERKATLAEGAQALAVVAEELGRMADGIDAVRAALIAGGEHPTSPRVGDVIRVAGALRAAARQASISSGVALKAQPTTRSTVASAPTRGRTFPRPDKPSRF